MNKLFSAILATGLVLLIASCGTSPDKMTVKITKLEQEMKSQSPADTAKVNALIDAYEQFAAKFPKDTLAPEYLFRAGGLCLSFNQANKSLEIFRKVDKEYPSYKRAGECLFMQGFIFENALGDINNAGKIYREFLDKYPNHPLTDDAELSLKYLGRPAEDIIHDIEQKAADSVATAQKQK
jgi:tetratricopeptide (TPR) repeat protein